MKRNYIGLTHNSDGTLEDLLFLEELVHVHKTKDSAVLDLTFKCGKTITITFISSEIAQNYINTIKASTDNINLSILDKILNKFKK